MVKIWLVSSGSSMTSGLLYVCPAVTEHKHNTNGKLTLKHISLQQNVVSPFSRSQLDHPTFLFNADAAQNIFLIVSPSSFCSSVFHIL